MRTSLASSGFSSLSFLTSPSPSQYSISSCRQVQKLLRTPALHPHPPSLLSAELAADVRLSFPRRPLSSSSQRAGHVVPQESKFPSPIASHRAKPAQLNTTTLNRETVSSFSRSQAQDESAGSTPEEANTIQGAGGQKDFEREEGEMEPGKVRPP